MIKQVIQQLRVPDAGIENLQERRYWLQCERAYNLPADIPDGWPSDGG